MVSIVIASPLSTVRTGCNLASKKLQQHAFSAPPMTFEVVAIASGTDPASGKRRRANAPELNEQRDATMLYVIGL